MIDDYLQDCAAYLSRRLNKNPEQTFNTGYLKQLATKICVDNLRSSGTPIKYHCGKCKSFYNRKEKAVKCCDKAQEEEVDQDRLFGVSRAEASYDIFSTPKFSEAEIGLNNHQEAALVENDFINTFEEILSDEDFKVFVLLLDGNKKMHICKTVNIKIGQLRKKIKYFRYLYFKLKERDLI